MSLRTALIGGVSLLLVVAMAIVITIGATSIHRGVVREAQQRVDHDLNVLSSLYDKDMRLAEEAFRFSVDEVDLTAPGPELDARLSAVRQRLGFAVLNYCGPDGEPRAGGYPDRTAQVPVPFDPVIRTALGGEPAAGTVCFDPERLRLEGGPALVTSQRVPPPEGWASGGTRSSLFQWFALPVTNERGTVTGVVYGGRSLNHRNEFVDMCADILFGTAQYAGKPRGTVTIFLDGTRVATNVRDSQGQRALGTEVSAAVRNHVLGGGNRWTNRAWVVDAWYLSGYEPLRNPEGEIIGMLYVGLLEAPYNAVRTKMILRFALPAGLLLAVGLLAAIYGVRRITRPLQRLQDKAGQIAAGQWETPVTAGDTYAEIHELAEALHRMQEAIHQRDRQLRSKNEQLGEANEALTRVNNNYMSMLGFVTHELKAPLANVQSLANLLVEGYICEVPEAGQDTLRRIKRNCEELQDMVKNYLDLSRAERGELESRQRPIDLVADVVQPCVGQAEELFRSRRMTFRAEQPESLAVQADPELLRIALTNYLNNAAKYGREGGRAELKVYSREDEAVVEMWNEGAGFRPAEREQLFKKFSRLQNDNTKSKKGSGLGLFLAAQVIRQHAGEVWAESEPGEWARFGFRFPVGPPPTNGPAAGPATERSSGSPD